MEDTHVWLMNADGSNRREIGSAIDNRQGTPHWTPDGSAVYVTVQERGSFHLVRLPIAGGQPEYLVKDVGAVGGISIAKNGAMAYTFTSPRISRSFTTSRAPGRRGSLRISIRKCSPTSQSRRWNRSLSSATITILTSKHS